MVVVRGGGGEGWIWGIVEVEVKRRRGVYLRLGGSVFG